MLDWKDGLPYSNRYGDVYFSADSGLEETRHVFLEANRLPERFAALRSGESLAIGETGFGTGLNFLCTWQVFRTQAAQGASLDFFSVEKFPLEDTELEAALALWPELAELAQELRTRWRRRVPGWNRWSFDQGRVRLTLVIGDVASALPGLPVGAMDAWFLDGFSPARNPEMWSPEVMRALARASRPAATLATYTSAGWVRRGLAEAGFVVEKQPGFGRKREMLCGQLPGATVQRAETPQVAIVIGGGVAGCAAAYALARRGIGVTLIEQADRLAAGASGNPRGILHARYSAGMNPLHQFVLASYGHALGLLDEVLPVGGENRAECGVLQLAFSENERLRMDKLLCRDWEVPVFRPVNARQASELVGVAVEHGGLWFPSGGWVVPPVVCQRLAGIPGIVVRTGLRVENLQRQDGRWLVTGVDGTRGAWQMGADMVVVACAHQARRLTPFGHFPLTPVRGQVSLLPTTETSRTLQAVVCGDGYCAPAAEGRHVVGATHAFDDEGCDLRAEDHAENLARMSELMPGSMQASGEGADFPGRASVRCSAPGAMPLVGKVADGLYCSLAHGTRGLLTAGLAGELIASQALHTLPPLAELVVVALSPVKRVKTGQER